MRLGGRFFCVALAVGINLAACTRRSGNYLADGKIPITVEQVAVEPRDLVLSLPMALIPSDKAEIQFAADLKIGRVFVQVGDTVAANDPLFQLDIDDLTLKLAQMKAQRNEQEAAVEKNDYFFRNRERLYSEGKIDKSQYDGLESELNASQTTFERIKNDITLLENQLNQTSFSSPIAGLVTAKNITQGSVAPAKQVLVTVIKTDPIYAAFKVDAQSSGAIVKGSTVTVRLEDLPDENSEALITYVEPQIDPATKTFAVWASLPNPNGVLKAGMGGSIQLQTTQKVRTLLIPQEAVMEELGRQFVFTVRNGRAFRVRIFPHKTDAGVVEISDGLNETDGVVSKGKEQLRDGMPMAPWQ